MYIRAFTGADVVSSAEPTPPAPPKRRLKPRAAQLSLGSSNGLATVTSLEATEIHKL